MRPFRVAVLLSFALTAAACGSATPSSGGPAPVDADTEPPTPSSAEATDETTPPEVEGLRFGALRVREIDIDADGRDTTAAVASINRFAIDLFRAVGATEPGNLVVSPYSVAFALGMIYAGAGGDTAAEMGRVLHADDPAVDWHQGINAYDLTLDARTAGSPTTWRSANKVWTAPRLPLLPQYLDVLTGAYGSPLAEADFATATEESRRAINGWIAGQTDDLVPELFAEGAIPPETVMVLVNAIALDAPWEFPFDPAATSDMPFTLADGTSIAVPTMHYDEYLPSAVGPDYQAVTLPYGGGALEMVVIVPTDLAAFEAGLTVESLETVLGAITDGGIHLSLPRWSTRSHTTLNDVLAGLGMPSAFGPGADFSGMLDGGGVWLSRVEHEAFVEVDEDGTRAAAATGGVMVASHGPTVDVNRPFLYVIRDSGAGTILFVGRITDPTANG